MREPASIPPPAREREGTRFGTHLPGHERDRRTAEQFMRQDAVTVPAHLHGASVISGPAADALPGPGDGKGAGKGGGQGAGKGYAKGYGKGKAAQDWSAYGSFGRWVWNEVSGYRKGEDGSWASARWHYQGGGWILH